MQEVLDKIFTYMHGVWRFRWYAVLLAWILAPVGWVVVFKIPNMYESKAQVYVDTDSILKPLLRNLAVDTVDLNERLGMMTTALLSRQNMEKIVRSADLDVGVQNDTQLETVIFDLQRNIQIEATRTHRTPNPKPPNLFILSARNSDPKMAHKIVQSLLDIFLESSLGGNREDTDIAQRFIEQQIKEYEARLVAAENRLREFKRKHIGTLPEQGSNYYQRLQVIQNNLDAILLEIREEENRKKELQRQLSGVNPNQAVIGVNGTPVLSPTDQRISALQARLDELLLKYTEQHPDILETRSALMQLENEKATQEKGDVGRAANNPMYQQIKVALGEVEANLAALKVRKNEYSARHENLKQQIEILPKVEAELTALNRDYQINKTNYDALIERREAAKISEQAEQTGEKVDLKIIDPPRTPLAPYSPNRPMLSTVVMFLSLVMGVALAFLLSQIKPVFYNIRMIRSKVSLPVFGSVSMMTLPETVQRRRLQLIAFFMAMVLYMIAYGTVLYMHIAK